jgi:hypothetical protein
MGKFCKSFPDGLLLSRDVTFGLKIAQGYPKRS